MLFKTVSRSSVGYHAKGFEMKLHVLRRLMAILEIVGSTMAEEYLLTDEQINHFIDLFFSKLPDYLRDPLLNAGAA